MSFFSSLRNNKVPAPKNSDRPGLIGLDIGNNSIHLCQLKVESDNRYIIIAKSSLPFDMSRQDLLNSPKQFKSLIAKAIKGKKFKGRKVTAILPPDKVKIMLLTYKANVSDIDAEVVKMITQRIDGNVDDYIIDYLPVRNSSSDEEHIVMASVARREQVEQFLQLLTYAGLQPHSLDIGPAALRRLISVLYTNDKTSNVLLINTGDETSYLTIVSGRRLLLDQPVKFGCEQLFQEISNTLDLPIDKVKQLVYQHGFTRADNSKNGIGLMSQTEVSDTLLEIVKPAFLNLVEEINRVLIFTASETHGIPLSRVYLLGDIARLPGAHDLMMSLMEISMPEYQTDFYEIFLDDNDETEPWSNQLPELAIATGLALRGIQPDA